MATHFVAGALEGRYAFLDDCPEALLPDVVALPVGTLEERVAGVRAWRTALLAGQLPPEDGWPPPEVGAPARRALAELGVARFCRGQEALVDALLGDLLRALGRRTETLAQAIDDRLRELERLERLQLAENEAARARRQHRDVRRIELSEEARRRLRESARREVLGRDAGADGELLGAWGERARAWAAVADVFGDLGEMMGRGWDLCLGVLRHTGWLDLVKLRELVARLPQLREVVRALGRLHATPRGESVAERLLVPVRRVEEERREIRTPLAPTEARGVERSGEIGRMLPAEAALLGHPRLRLLWHARRAERALLTYRVEGVLTEVVQVEREAQEETEGPRPRPERGPIVLLIDTSGSMHGVPEQVAKALALEAVRTAHAERRACYLYAYSGPGQVLEHELDLSPDGIGELLRFLGLSFGGGNDETGVMMRALAWLEEEGWRRADVLLISDGEWPVPAALEEAVRRAREGGTRFHGVQVGNLGVTGLHRLCDPVHVFRDWATLGGWGAAG